MTDKVCAIVGAGPGNGAAFARRFAADGYRVALLARDERRLESLARGIPKSTAFGCDVTQNDSIEAAFSRIERELGPVRTLIYNAGNFIVGSVLDSSPAALELGFRINCTGCLVSVQRVLGGMLAAGAGEIVIIGATTSRRGAANTLPFATAKSGQRIMAESMARALGPRGVHVAYVVIDGVIDTPATRRLMSDRPDDFFLQADDIASAVAHLVQQGRSAWTFELDVRPFNERW